jgi:hypothetical protein
VWFKVQGSRFRVKKNKELDFILFTFTLASFMERELFDFIFCSQVYVFVIAIFD